MTAIKRRIEKLEASYPTDPEAIAWARVRAMSVEEINAEIRRLMLKNGYNPSLPHEVALARYIEKLEAELPGLGEKEQGWQRQILDRLRQGKRDLSRLFPESPPSCENGGQCPAQS